MKNDVNEQWEIFELDYNIINWIQGDGKGLFQSLTCLFKFGGNFNHMKHA